jgi:hypothetical protein
MVFCVGVVTTGFATLCVGLPALCRMSSFGSSTLSGILCRRRDDWRRDPRRRFISIFIMRRPEAPRFILLLCLVSEVQEPPSPGIVLRQFFPAFWPSYVLFPVSRNKHDKFGANGLWLKLNRHGRCDENIQESGPHRKENSTLHHYKDQLVNAVYSENHAKPINTLCGQNSEMLIIKAGGTYSCHWAFKGTVFIISYRYVAMS